MGNVLLISASQALLVATSHITAMFEAGISPTLSRPHLLAPGSFPANRLTPLLFRFCAGVMSIAAVGLTVDPEAMQEARDATNAALGLLSELFPAVISALHSNVDGVAMATVPFLLAYMQRIKRCCLPHWQGPLAPSRMPRFCPPASVPPSLPSHLF